jgi:AcrR family transcriptional regulator
MSKRYDRAESARLLLEASAVEFAQHGVGGARIDRIAERAGVNKASIYTYFGKKDDLFEAAITEKLGELAHQVVIQSDDLAGYVGELFDFLCDTPMVVRLFEQEALHYTTGAVPNLEERAAYFQSRVEAVAAGIPRDSDAAATFFSLIAMCYWFVAAPQLVGMVFGGDDAADVKRRYRRHIVAVARTMAGEKGDAVPAAV